jgi:[protein-PII] uridylyltransferase
VLTLHNLSVLSAQIFTWEGDEGMTVVDGQNLREPGTALAVDVLEVRSYDGLSFHEKDWATINADLDRALGHRLGLEHRIHQKLATVYERRKQSGVMLGQQQARVVIDNTISETYTVIEVHSDDRAGQLYRITQVLADFGINIYRAFIATEVQQLIDNFYVLDSEGKKIADEDFVAEIRDGVLYAMEREL